jgi:hypothetical protein
VWDTPGVGWLEIVATGVTKLLAPLAKLGPESWRLKRQSRVARISEWREGVAEMRTPEYIIFEKDCTNSAWFNTLKPMLSKTALQSVETLSGKPDKISNVLEAEIARIEQKKWKLL